MMSRRAVSFFRGLRPIKRAPKLHRAVHTRGRLRPRVKTPSKMSSARPVIKTSQMTTEMQEFAVSVAHDSLSNGNTEQVRTPSNN